MGLTAVILTNKTQKDIRPTLDSVAFANEILVVKDHANDHPLEGDFARQRNYGLKKAKNAWVLFVDDDEIVPPDLAAEIKTAINSTRHNGYYLHRLDYYYSQPLRHGETGTIKLLRLAKKNAGQWVRPVHETWKIDGSVGELTHPLIHNRSDMVTSFINRVVLYGPIDAKALAQEGKPFSLWRLLFNPLAKFIVNYKLKFGFLDGYPGLFQAYLMSVQSLTVRVFQWQLKS